MAALERRQRAAGGAGHRPGHGGEHGTGGEQRRRRRPHPGGQRRAEQQQRAGQGEDPDPVRRGVPLPAMPASLTYPVSPGPGPATTATVTATAPARVQPAAADAATRRATSAAGPRRGRGAGRPGSATPVRRGPAGLVRPERHDAARVDLPVGAVVVPLDVVEVHRLAETRGLEQVPGVRPEHRHLGQLVAGCT